MRKVVRPLLARRIAFCISSSVRESMADVESSRMRILGSTRKARAMATRCFCPPEMDRGAPACGSQAGGHAERVDLDQMPDLSGERANELIALEDALDALAAIDARKARVVELRFYGGLSVEESATVLEVSPETVMRDWKFARSWLQAEMSRV